MKIVLNDIGALKGETVISPAALTVFCGGNNTGKTYAMYILWAILQRRVRHIFGFAEELAVQLKAAGSIQLPLEEFFTRHWHAIERGISAGLTERLPTIFSAPPANFKEARASVSVDIRKFFDLSGKRNFQGTFDPGEAARLLDVRLNKTGESPTLSITANNLPQSLIAELLSQFFIEMAIAPHAESAFLLPAERGGLNLFYPDLDAKNSALIRHLKRDDLNPVELFKDVMVAQYAEPIDAYIQFLRRAPRIARGEGSFHDQALILQKKIAHVRYKITKEGVITAKPYRSEAELGIHLTSSTVKNFYGLWAWLELQANPGDCLMIDEPELNLHPDNQRLVARMLVRLVNRGVRVVISTHSDYVVREINNMVMLGSDFPERAGLEARFGYDPDGQERLCAEQVAAYHFTDKCVDKAEVSSEFGIEIKSMDDAINRLNESNSAIYFALGDQLHPAASSEHLQVEAD